MEHTYRSKGSNPLISLGSKKKWSCRGRVILHGIELVNIFFFFSLTIESFPYDSELVARDKLWLKIMTFRNLSIKRMRDWKSTLCLLIYWFTLISFIQRENNHSYNNSMSDLSWSCKSNTKVKKNVNIIHKGIFSHSITRGQIIPKQRLVVAIYQIQKIQKKGKPFVLLVYDKLVLSHGS